MEINTWTALSIGMFLYNLLRPHFWRIFLQFIPLVMDTHEEWVQISSDKFELLRPHVVFGRKASKIQRTTSDEPVTDLDSWNRVRSNSLYRSAHSSAKFLQHPYGAGETLLLKVDGTWAVASIFPVRKKSEEDQPPHLCVKIFTRRGALLPVLKKMTPPPPKNICKVCKVYAENRSGNPYVKDTTHLDGATICVPRPGFGCAPGVWASLNDIMLQMACNAIPNVMTGIPPGAAVLLVGPPGTGKSTLAAHIAVQWSLPRLHHVVVSEANRAMPTVHTNAGCILWPDVGGDGEPVQPYIHELGVVLVDDVDRIFKEARGISLADTLSWVDETISHPNLLIFTANSITQLDPAFLSRVTVMRVGHPTAEEMPERIQATLGCTPEQAQAWAKELEGEEVDLRELRRRYSARQLGESFPDAWRRVKAAEEGSKRRAKEDGDKWVTPE